MISGELVTSVELDVQPDYGMFGLGDGWDTGGNTPVPAPGWLGVGEEKFLVGVAGPVLHSEVRLELWTGGLPPCEPGHDVQETVELRCPTGEIDLDQITLGGEAGVLTVPTGVYSVRITGWGREQVRAAPAEAEERYADDEDGLENAQESLLGTERFSPRTSLRCPRTLSDSWWPSIRNAGRSCASFSGTAPRRNHRPLCH